MRDRRQFLKHLAAGMTTGLLGSGTAAAHWMTRARAARDKLKITDIQRYELYLPYHEFNGSSLFRYHGYRIQATTVLLVKTNLGLTGAGESWSVYQLPEKWRERYIGSSPFDWLGARSELPLNMAMYDLMGKYLDIPAWKLIGEQVRTRIPVSAWTVSQTPEMMAQEVKHAAALGYRWLKYHIDEVQNVVDQTRAMQAVAPPGFQVHYDFNMNSRREFIEPVLDALKPFPIVGRIEDPIDSGKPADWKSLCDKYDWPIVAHHGPLDFILNGSADGYMAGHAPIGHAARIASVAEQVQKPLMLQQAGSYINQAFLAHEASVFPTARMDHVNLAELWRDRVVNEKMPIHNGSIAVPDRPGLGVTVNVEKLQHLARAPRPAYKPFLVKIMYDKGPTIIARHNANVDGHTDDMRFLNRLLGNPIPGPRPAYANNVRTEWWSAPDDPAFQRAWQATSSRKYIVE